MSFMAIRTVLINRAPRPLRMPYAGRFSPVLQKAGDSMKVDGHLESMVLRPPVQQALAEDVKRGWLELKHEVQRPNGEWTSLEGLLLLVDAPFVAPAAIQSPAVERPIVPTPAETPAAPLVEPKPAVLIVPAVIIKEPIVVTDPIIETTQPVVVEPAVVEPVVVASDTVVTEPAVVKTPEIVKPHEQTIEELIAEEAAAGLELPPSPLLQ